MTIKGNLLFKMSYKELKEDNPEPPKTSNCIAYAEIMSTLVMVGMFCGTLIMTTRMWVQEREIEVGYLRGINP